MRILRNVIVVGACALLSACAIDERAEEAELISHYEPVTTQADFEARVIGRHWKSGPADVTFAKDGSLSGNIDGVPVNGTWVWDDGMLCTAFRAADSGGEGCSKLRHRGDEMLVIPRGGTGAPYTYTAA